MQAITYPCPNCGQPYQLDSAYLAQYGGQTTACTRCQQPMVLPTAEAAAVYAAGSAGVAGSVLPYASPATSVTSSAVASEGKLVVVADGTTLPPSCVKCGAPATGQPFKRTYYWHPPAYYLLILAGLLIYVIVALVVRKKATVAHFLCDAHRAKRRNAMAVGWIISLIGVAMIFAYAARIYRDFDGLIPFGIVALVAGLIVAAVSARMLSPQRIDQGYVWLNGSGKAFRGQFPSTRDIHAAQQYAQSVAAAQSLQSVV